MKFVFEADMKKGDCSSCPLCEYDYHNDCGEFYCAIDNSMVSLEVDPADCPLEEHHGIEWHPYPQEKPTENEKYLLTCQYPHCIGVTFGKWWDDEFVDIDEERKILAWAELPKPYEEEE